LTAKGVKPICTYQNIFKSTYIFGAFSPFNGDSLVMELPYCNGDNFQIFLNELSNKNKEEFKVVILDNGAFHKGKSLIIPENIALVFLPPYSPELNPAELVWLNSHPLKRAIFNFHKNKNIIFSIDIEQIIKPKNNLYLDLVKSKL
jgi:transposase